METNTNVVETNEEVKASETQNLDVKKDNVEQKDIEKKEEKLFTQDDVNKIVQDRLAKEKIKNEKAQEEAKKLAKMNADEKAKYELEKKEADFARREAELNKRELTATAKDILAEKGLPNNLHTILNYESADTVNESIKVVEKAIQKAVEKAVEERLKGNAPKKSIGISEGINYFERGAKVN